MTYYHRSKFALEGMSESLGKEIRHLGIHVTAVEPGSFRTDWAGRLMVLAPRSIADYDTLTHPIRARRDPGPARPSVARLGRLADEKLAELQTDIAAWQEVTQSTDDPA